MGKNQIDHLRKTKKKRSLNQESESVRLSAQENCEPGTLRGEVNKTLSSLGRKAERGVEKGRKEK